MVLARVLSAAALVLAIVGCSGRPARVAGPNLDASDIAARAIKQYDKNGDGKLTGDELSPGLKALLKTADKDRDGALTQSEIADRMAVQVKSMVGLMQVAGMVTLDGHPLPDAAVRFVPDPVLEGIVQPAAGRTDGKGFVSLKIEGQNLPGVTPGFYRVEVSKKDASNRETLPARYNSSSELGEEVGEDTLRGGLKLDLRSR